MLALHCSPYEPGLWARIAPAWGQLYARSGTRSAFLAGGWMGAWFDAFGAQLEPAALTWLDAGGEVVALALVSLPAERAGPVRIRAAYLNATGENRVAAEHNRVLCVPGLEPAVHDSLVDWLRWQRVDMLRLCGFEPDCAAALAQRWRAGTDYGFTSEDRYVALDQLRDAGQTYLKSLSRNTREQINRSLRLYEQQCGAPRCERLTEPAAMDAAFAELAELHAARWKARGEPGVFAEERVRRFHARLRAADAAGGPGVEFVRVSFGDQTVGLLYNLLQDGRVNFYQSGFRYEADRRLKPGLVAHALAVQQYADAGFGEYDFLAGEAVAVQYKGSLGRHSRPLVWRDLGVRSPKMRAIDAVRRLRRWMRRRGSPAAPLADAGAAAS